MSARSKSLIIVESPTKARTISGFLGRGFKVISSFGHIRDLPKSRFGIDIKEEGGKFSFTPEYIIPIKSRKAVTELKKEALSAGKIILATDEDREGEAIAFHLSHILKSSDGKWEALSQKPLERIVFHEITRQAIEEALKNPRTIDEHLVNAQQARRLLDRIVGYKLSPFLWKKVARGLSAGRVQSVALRLICERGLEIKNFKSVLYYSIEAVFKTNKGEEFTGKLYKIDNKTLDVLALQDKEEVEKLRAAISSDAFSVAGVNKKEIVRRPPPPFVTSTLAQEAFKRLHFPARMTMSVAQHLYEGKKIGKEHVGLITYMRTDSTNLNMNAIFGARSYIEKNFGKEFVPEKPNFYKTKSKLAQEAHEAIRPTNPGLDPESVREYLDKPEYKLYDLIFRRFIACQMKPAILDETTIEVAGKKERMFVFKSRGAVKRFAGFQGIWPSHLEEYELPVVTKGEKVALGDCVMQEHETQPPPRYSDASLIKTLEEYNIGRPSTYAPTIQTLLNRGYVVRNKNRVFEETELGELVNSLITEHFPQIVDYAFTSQMEDGLDDIAQNKKQWQELLADFYPSFAKLVSRKEQEIQKEEVSQSATDVLCEKCGKNMIRKIGRFGPYLACPGFPECKNTKSLKDPPKKTGVACPQCKNGEVVERRNRRKQLFFGCSAYPACTFTAPSLEKISGAALIQNIDELKTNS